MSNEIIKVISLRGEVIENETLDNLKNQLNGETFNKLVMKIASRGGSVKEGLEIMVWMNELSKQGVEVVTVVEANAYSIASLIMLAADVKLISKHGEVMVHNPMLPELKYVNANELETHLNKLRELESAMYGIYQMFTGLKSEDIKKLMDNETYLNPEDSVKYGFADMVIDMKPKPYDEESEAENKITNINMIKHINSLKKVIKLVNNDEFVNLTYNTVGGSKLEIFQDDASAYKKGDKTDLENGTVKLGDGATLEIKDYKIENITKEVEATKVEASNVGEAPEGDDKKEAIDKAKNVVEEDVENAQISRVSTWESTVVNDSFEIGDVVEYPANEMEPDATSVGAGEWCLEDGRKFLTDSRGVIQIFLDYEKSAEAPAVEPEVEEAPVVEPEAEEVVEDDKEVEEVVEAIEGEEPKVEEEPKAEHEPGHEEPKAEEVVEDDSKELEEAKATILSFEARFKAMEEKMQEMEKGNVEADMFREKAAEAISTIAEQTTSNFKPNASSTNSPQQLIGSSIFKRAKARNNKNK